jgi:hypothetical protein
VDADAAVVLDEAELSEAIHEEADARAGGADHLGEGLLGDGRDEGLGFAGLAELGHEEEGAGEAFFAGVEELIDEVSLGSHAAGEQEANEEVGEGVLLVEDADHLIAIDLERGAGGEGGSGGHAQAAGRAGDRLLPDKVAGNDVGDGGFLAFVRDDGELGAAALEEEDAVAIGSLSEEDAFGFEMDDSSSYSLGGEECFGIKVFISRFRQHLDLSF